MTDPRLDGARPISSVLTLSKATANGASMLIDTAGDIVHATVVAPESAEIVHIFLDVAQARMLVAWLVAEAVVDLNELAS